MSAINSEEIAGAIWYLERARRRVAVGYCWSRFYAKKRWWRSAPRFCMSGALYFNDAGKWEFDDIFSDAGKNYQAKQMAIKIAESVISGKSLTEYGTRPFAKHRVLRAYDKAIEVAKTRLGRELK